LEFISKAFKLQLVFSTWAGLNRVISNWDDPTSLMSRIMMYFFEELAAISIIGSWVGWVGSLRWINGVSCQIRLDIFWIFFCLIIWNLAVFSNFTRLPEFLQVWLGFTRVGELVRTSFEGSNFARVFLDEPTATPLRTMNLLILELVRFLSRIRADWITTPNLSGWIWSVRIFDKRYFRHEN
jgi:hypothetical protein